MNVPNSQLTPTKRLFDVSEYQRMGETGILLPDERTELINGVVMLMNPPTSRLFTIDEYNWMYRAYILRPNEQTELINGEVVSMGPVSSRRAAHIAWLDETFHDLLGKSATIMSQSPLSLAETQLPKPDLMVLKRRSDFYSKRLPIYDDTILLVEFIEGRLPFGISLKLSIYSHANIPIVWVVNLQDQIIQVFSNLAGGNYQDMMQVASGSLSIPTFPDLSLDVDSLFNGI